MQRTLVLIRHAKSSWANAMQSDFDRPLNDRGEQEAPEMGDKLKALGAGKPPASGGGGLPGLGGFPGFKKK